MESSTGRNSPLSPSSSAGKTLESLAKYLDELDEEMEKSKPFQGNEEKVAGLGGEDVVTEESKVKDRNLILEEGGLGNGENVDQGCGLASDQEKKFKGEEGSVAGGTSKECSKGKEKMKKGEECKEGPSGVKNSDERSDEHIEIRSNVLIQLAELKNVIQQTLSENARLLGEIQDMQDNLTGEIEREGRGLEVEASAEGNTIFLKEEVLKHLVFKLSECVVKKEEKKKQKSEIENSLDLLSKKLEEEQLKLERLKGDFNGVKWEKWFISFVSGIMRLFGRLRRKRSK